MATALCKTHLQTDLRYSKDMAECLLFYFDRHLWLKVKNEIKKTCCIESEHLWSDEEIKKAWDEIDKTKKKKGVKVKQWAYVITFQIKDRIDYEEHNMKGEVSNLTESEKPSDNERSSPSDRKKRLSQSEAKQVQSKSNEEDDQSNRDDVAVSFTVICIPLSELFASEATPEPATPAQSEYKLTDGCPSRNKIIKKKSYVMSFNKDTNNAEWVYEILNKQTLAEKYSAKQKFPKCKIEEGYDKGHLAAARNHRWCKEAYKDTYDLINMSPQLRMLNKGMWENLEKDCHSKADHSNVLNVHVYTGTILDSQSVNQKGNKKAVPDYFYKVIIVENDDGTVLKPEVYLIPNNKTKLMIDIKDLWKCRVEKRDWFKTDIVDIEGRSGLKFCVNTIQNYRDEIRSVTWTGEDGEGELQSACISVRITIPE